MPKKKSKSSLLSLEDQLKWARELLESNGYSVFRLEDVSNKEEEDSVKKLTMLGYRVEHFRDRIVKIDANLITDSDDIVIYFHKMMERYNKDRFNKAKLKNKEDRAIDRSIVNSFLNWRVNEGKTSLIRAIEELFVMIDLLFQKRQERGLDIRSMGILSINNTKNRPFIITLLREAHIEQDRQLEYEMDCIVEQEDAINYFDVLYEARQKMATVSDPPPLKKRKIKTKE